MTKCCPIMSYRKDNWNNIYCSEKECAWWDEAKEQCCLKSAALAVAGKKSGGPGSIPLQAEYVYASPPPHIPNSTGDWVNPHPYTITCDLGEIV